MRNPLTVIGGIVCLFLFGMTAVVVLAVVGQGLSENARLIVIASIFSALSGAVPGLLALFKSEATQNDLRNGVVKEQMTKAIVEVAADTDSEGVYLNTHGLSTGKETNDG